MCFKDIEKWACNHNVEDFIPCESFLDTQKCDPYGIAQQDKVAEHEEKCHECTHFDNEMKKLSEDTELSKPVEKTAAKSHDGPKLFFTACWRASNCKRRSPILSFPRSGSRFIRILTRLFLDIFWPSETDVERQPDQQEFLEQELEGRCGNCQEASEATIAEMKANGKLDTDDPWGAMTIPAPAAAGSSSQGIFTVAPKTPEPEPEPPSVPFDDLDEEPESPEDKARLAGYATGAPTSHAPETKKKGKGRAGMPEDTYASRYGGAPPEAENQSEDSDDGKAERSDEEDAGPRGRSDGNKQAQKDEYEPSDDEDNELQGQGAGKKQAQKAAPVDNVVKESRGLDVGKKQVHKGEPSDEEEEESSVDEEEEEEEAPHAQPGSQKPSPEANIPARDRSYSPGPDRLVSGGLQEPAKESPEEENPGDDPFFISQADRKTFHIKSDQVITEEIYKIFESNQKAMNISLSPPESKPSK